MKGSRVRASVLPFCFTFFARKEPWEFPYLIDHSQLLIQFSTLRWLLVQTIENPSSKCLSGMSNCDNGWYWSVKSENVESFGEFGHTGSAVELPARPPHNAIFGQFEGSVMPKNIFHPGAALGNPYFHCQEILEMQSFAFIFETRMYSTEKSNGENCSYGTDWVITVDTDY